MTLSGMLPLLIRRREFLFVCEQLAQRRHPWVTGPSGAAKALVIGGLVTRVDAPAWVIMTPERDHAEKLADDLAAFLPSDRYAAHLLTPWESFNPEDRPPVEMEGARQRVLESVRRGRPHVIVTSAAGALHRVADPRWVDTVRVDLTVGGRGNLEQIVRQLAAAGYERADLVQRPGEMAVRGGLIDVYPSTGGDPVRIEWAGDEVESVRVFDAETQRTVKGLAGITLLPARSDPGAGIPLVDLVPDAVCILDEPNELERQARGLYDQAIAARQRGMETGRVPPDAPMPLVSWETIAAALEAHRTGALSALHRPARGQAVEIQFGPVESFAGQIEGLARELRKWGQAGRRIVVATRQAHRMVELLSDHHLSAGLAGRLDEPPAPGSLLVAPQALTTGFTLDDLVVVTDAEILGWRRRRRPLKWLHDGAHLSSWSDLSPGDLVVHIHHGIGVYRGLERLAMGGGERDYLHLGYAQGDALYVPTDQINLVQRYVGVEGQAPQVHRLGGTEWEREKRRVRERTREMARDLLTLYAARESKTGHAFAPDTPWQREMEEAFAYEETPDQWQAIQDVKRDMETSRPMDRLVSGDVGYGKTEVAVRAAFKAVMDGKQVAVLVPTTILAQQHFTVFRERFAAFPVRVEMLSRFRSPKEQNAVIESVRTGAVDVLVGTHRILSRTVKFKDLGLVIVDEEQRFGVTHKERLKQLRTQVDVLTLTATPIPRTLHMSLAGLRDLSVMETPPDARQPIRTVIREENPALVAEAIEQELGRGGQVYVIHNRVETIERAATRLRRLAPQARIAVAHGQMPEERLERIMLDFLGGRYDVLVCTTIVEIGLDIPRVNTIVIEDAHRLGLAQLYQLRGRVGRADRQAYAYLLYPRHARLTGEAEQRLMAMREFVELGSGLRLAMRDLEIRGAGNLLGPEQHGHLAAVGFDLYTQLLEQALRETRGESVEEPMEVAIDLDIAAYLPDTYISSPAQRMAAYRQLAAARTVEEGRTAVDELRDRYGPLPQPVQHLAEVIRLRVLARRAGVASISQERTGVLLRLADPSNTGDRARVLAGAWPGRIELTPEGILVRADAGGLPEMIPRVGDLLDALAVPDKAPVRAARAPLGRAER
ncbi:MAG TPA: transcription-repair coupling factor [bacterium]|nr:transcription-repair coupling factor [bacterium]